MIRRTSLFQVVFLVGIFLLSSIVPVMGRDIGGEYVPGQLIIGFSTDMGGRKIKAAVKGFDGEILKKARHSKAKVRLVGVTGDLDAKIAEIENSDLYRDGKIRYVERNAIKRVQGFKVADLSTEELKKGASGDASVQSQSADPLLDQEWGFYDIEANLITAGLKGAGVAVLDTGVDYTHPDLGKKTVKKGIDFINGDKDPMDDFGHGTHVAGTIAASINNQVGVAGISPFTKIVPVKVLNSAGWGTTMDIALGIIYAANNKTIRILSMSLSGSWTQTEQDVVDYAVNTKGKLLIAAAGNDGIDPEVAVPADPTDPVYPYPAYFATMWPGKVLAVAAYDSDRCMASFSNFGNWVSIAAPGVDILSTMTPAQYGGPWGYDYWSGTSMATPHVSAAAALLWAQHPTWSNQAVGDALTTFTNAQTFVRDDSCWPNDGSSFESLNLYNALQDSDYAGQQLGRITGYAMDAESGEPLAGALVFTRMGRTKTGLDFVPYWGTHLVPSNDSPAGDFISEGFGHFLIQVNPAGTTNSMGIVKKGYNIYTLNNIDVPLFGYENVGTISVPPKKASSKWFITFTTDYGQTITDYDLYVYNDIAGWISYDSPGNLALPPFARHYWDSWDEWGGPSLRGYSESIRIRKQFDGIYTVWVVDYSVGEGSTAWDTTGIKLTLWRGSKIAAVLTPPPGSVGQCWYLGYILGGDFYPGNTVSECN